MFKESIENKKARGDPKELNEAIDAYQKQIRDFKNSLTEMER